MIQMPTVLSVFGWRFFFYANEGNEPIHIHCKSGEKNANFGLTKRISTFMRRFLLTFLPRIGVWERSWYFNTLNLLKRNGPNFRGENPNEKVL
jgi:hypothetical protein